MQKLIVVRHGDYDRLSQKLTEWGRRQIGVLGEKIRSFRNGSSIVIISSDDSRTKESAGILGEMLDVSPETQVKLYSSEISPANLPWAFALVKSLQEKWDIVILVTHFEYVGELPAYYAQNELGLMARSWEIEKGGAWVVDCKKREIEHFWAAH